MQAAEIERLEDFVRRFGAKASKASQAQSRQKQLDKLRKSAISLPAAASGAGPGDARKVITVSSRADRVVVCNYRAKPNNTAGHCQAFGQEGMSGQVLLVEHS